MVDFVQELGAGDRAVAAEGVHHPRIRRYGEGPVPQHAAIKREREYRWMDTETVPPGLTRKRTSPRL